MKKVLTMIFLLILFLPFTVSANVDEVLKQERAVIAMIDAYFNQGSQVHYDSFRKQLYATPEDATSQHIVYTVCSGIAFQSYYQALGIKIPDTTSALLAFAKDNDGSSYVLDYYDKAELSSLGTSFEEIGTIIYNKWLPIVRPGDILVHTGHAILIYDVDVNNNKIMILEAGAGGRYDVFNHKDRVDSSNTLAKSSLSGRINSIVRNDEVALIRPTKDGNKYLKQNGTVGNYTYEELTYSGITPAAQTRLDYAGIDIEKTIDIKDGTEQNLLAGLNETIDYKIIITNKGTANYGALKVIEQIPADLDLANNGNGIVDGKTLTWNIDALNVGESITIVYSVKVPDNKNLFGKTFYSIGSVNNIKTARIETLIGTKYSSDDRNKLRLAYEDVKNNSSVERKFINDIYQKAFGIDLGISNLSNMDIIGYDASVSITGKDKLAVRRTKLKDTSVTKYVYGNFYGPRLFEGVEPSVNSSRDCPNSNLVRAMLHWNIFVENELNDRARNIFPSMLLDGDIILMYTNDSPTSADTTVCPSEILEDRSYIYLDNKLIRKKSATDFEEISGAELATFLHDLVGHNYVILRPSNERIIDDGKIMEEVEVEDTFATTSFPFVGLLLFVGGLGIWMVISKNKKTNITDDNV